MSAAWAQVVVVGHPTADEDARDPTAFSQVVRADEVPGARTVGDLIEAASGAEVRRTGGEGRAQSVQLRGAGAHQVVVLLDDIPLDAARGGGLDLSAVPLSFVDEVQVLRGPAAALYGSGAQGGVLRLRTAPARWGRRLRAQIRAGPGGLLSGTVGGSLAEGGAHLLALVTGSRADGDFAYMDTRGDARRRRNDDHLQGGGLLRGGLRLGGGVLTALVEGVAGARGEPGTEQFESLDARSARRRLQAAVSFRRPGPVRWTAVAFARVEGWRFEDPEAFGAAPRTFSQEDQVEGARVAAAWRGLELAAEGRREAARTTPAPGAPRSEARLRGAAVGVYTVHLAPWLRGQAALRLDGRSGRDAVWVPKLGLTVEPTSRLSLRANAGRTFRDPSFDELYFEGPGVRGDPSLRPEVGWAADVGAQWRPARGLEAELVGFTQRYERLILFVPVSAFQTRARGDMGATVEGLEARLGLRWGHLSVGLREDLTQHHFARAPHSPLPLRPRHRGQLQLGYRPGRARLFGRLGWRGAVTADRFGERTLPAYSLLEVGVEGPVAEGLRLRCTVHNALDVAAVDSVQRPSPGRGVYLGLRYEVGP